MIRAVFLDAGPLSLLAQRLGKSPEVDACKAWVSELALQGVEVCVPEVTDFEVRRELLRAGKAPSVGRLDRLKVTARYISITTETMLLAADLWAQSRRSGLPTADPKELDVDVILAAQALTFGIPPSELVVATTNPGHLTRFVPAERWEDIKP